jgi:DNA-binding NarL/FixJ family response regulator
MQNNTQKITIAIVDDSDPYREALSYYFSQLDDIEILFEASDGLELIENLKTKQPQVILLDMDMPNLNGLETLNKLRDEYPSIKFIILTMYNEKSVIWSFISNGANSYLNKSADAEEIYTAIVKCCDADFYMNDWINDALITKVKHTSATQKYLSSSAV